MDKPSTNASARSAPPSPRADPLGRLLELLLSDVATDIEVAARELGLRDEMLERLRRALEWLHCAQALVEAQRKCLLGSSSGEIWEQVGEAVRVLAENWPQDYPEGAGEWLLVGNAGRTSPECPELPG